MYKLVFLIAFLGSCLGQYAPQNQLTTPHPRSYHPPAPVHYVNIGAQLAGDYKFGYDTGKGPLGQSFREETRLPDGTVKGAYGILDASGQQRIIRYTAGKSGFTAEGDVGPNGAPGVYPGPAPQPVQAPAAQAAPQHYAPPAQQYSAPVQQQYNPPPQQQYQQQYQPQARPYRNEGRSWDPKVDDPYYQEGPAFIDVDRLTYNIGTSKQG